MGIKWSPTLTLIGGLLIGVAVGLLLITPYLVECKENVTSELNQILATWRSRHPDDPVAQGWAVTPPEVYEAAMAMTNFSWILTLIGVCLVIGGELASYYGH